CPPRRAPGRARERSAAAGRRHERSCTQRRRAARGAHPRRYSELRLGASEQRQHPVALERRHLDAVLLPLRTLVAEEEVEDVLAEGLREQLAVLRDRDRVVQAL